MSLPPQLLLHAHRPGAAGGAGGGPRLPRLRRVADGNASRAVSAPHTFVDSLPLSVCAFVTAVDGLRTRGGLAHVLPGSGSTEGWRGARAVHAAFLDARVPWPLLQRDGAADVLSATDRIGSNPSVTVGVSGHGQPSASVRVAADAENMWLAGTAQRVRMATRTDSDGTQQHAQAPLPQPPFPTAHAMLLRARPLQWDVPPAYEGVVSPVIVRLPDAATQTRFWVAAPVRSSGLQEVAPEWAAFCRGLCLAAVTAKPLPHVRGVLCPIVPCLQKTSRMQGVAELERPLLPSGGNGHHAVSSTALILDAQLDVYVNFTDLCERNGNEEPYYGAPSDSDSDSEDGEGAEDGGAQEPADAAAADAAAGVDTASPQRPRRMSLAFGPQEDLFLALCDTRCTLPLITTVVSNADLRTFKFQGPSDDGRDKDAAAIREWPTVRDTRQWCEWTADM